MTCFVPQHDVNVGPGIEFLGVDFDGNIYAGEVNRSAPGALRPVAAPAPRRLLICTVTDVY